MAIVNPWLKHALTASLLTLLCTPGFAHTPDEGAQTNPRLTARPQVAFGSELTLTALDEKTAFALSQAAIGKSVGDFALLDSEGKPVELSRYRGKPLLVSFIYTGCFQVCPTNTKNLQKALTETVSVLGEERFNIISIGFNQPFDSPTAMKSFATQHGITLPNWKFLSPAKQIVKDLTENFGFSYLATASGFDHLNQVTFVDDKGIIVRQVYGEKFTAKDIAEPLKLMVTGTTLPQDRSTVAELMERVRILCSVYDPVSGRYRTNYAVYFMVAGFVTFLGFLIYLSIHFWKNRRRDTPQAG